MKKVFWIINPRAGRYNARAELLDALSVFSKAGIQSTVYITQKQGDAMMAVKQAVGYDIVICCGGDGTLHEVINGLLECEQRIPLGYIPSGTTNDFANSLGLPRRFVDAAHGILEGTAYPLDVGSMQGQKFSYIASFGAFTKASYATSQKSKNILGHMAYLASGVRELTAIKSIPLRVRFDGQVYEEEYIFGAIANSTSVAGLFKLNREEVDFSDGKFEVLLVRKPQKFSEYYNILQSISKQKYDERYIRFFHTDEIEIESEEPLDWTLDGEYGGRHQLTAIHVLPRAVSLIKK